MLEQLGPDTATEDGTETMPEGTDCGDGDSGEGIDDGDEGVCGGDGVRVGVTECMDFSWQCDFSEATSHFYINVHIVKRIQL